MTKNYIKKVGGSAIKIYYKDDNKEGGRRLVEHNLVSSDFNPIEDVGRKNLSINLNFSIFQSNQFDDVSGTATDVVSILESAGLVEFGHQRLGVIQCFVDSFTQSYIGGAYSFECKLKEYVPEDYKVANSAKVVVIDNITSATSDIEQTVEEVVNIDDVPAQVVEKVGLMVTGVGDTLNEILKIKDKPVELLEKINNLKEKLNELTVIGSLQETISVFKDFDYDLDILKSFEVVDDISYLVGGYFYLGFSNGLAGNEVNDDDDVKEFLKMFNDFVFSYSEDLKIQKTFINILSGMRGLYVDGDLNTKGKVLLECKGLPYLTAWFNRFGNLDTAFDDKSIEQVENLSSCKEDVLVYE